MSEPQRPAGNSNEMSSLQNVVKKDEPYNTKKILMALSGASLSIKKVPAKLVILDARTANARTQLIDSTRRLHQINDISNDIANSIALLKSRKDKLPIADNLSQLYEQLAMSSAKLTQKRDELSQLLSQFNQEKEGIFDLYKEFREGKITQAQVEARINSFVKKLEDHFPLQYGLSGEKKTGAASMDRLSTASVREQENTLIANLKALQRQASLEAAPLAPSTGLQPTPKPGS